MTPPCRRCGSARSPAEAAAYLSLCEECYVVGLPAGIAPADVAARFLAKRPYDPKTARPPEASPSHVVAVF